MDAPKDLLAFLLDKYADVPLGDADSAAEPAPIQALDAQLETTEERVVARQGINHFLDFARQFLADHPPQTQVMLAQGFGVQLAGGYEVSLVPPLYDHLSEMEGTPAVHVTEGRSIRGQGGVQPSEGAHAITGGS